MHMQETCKSDMLSLSKFLSCTKYTFLAPNRRQFYSVPCKLVHEIVIASIFDARNLCEFHKFLMQVSWTCINSIRSSSAVVHTTLRRCSLLPGARRLVTSYVGPVSKSTCTCFLLFTLHVILQAHTHTTRVVPSNSKWSLVIFITRVLA